MLLVATSNCQRELKGEEGTIADTQELPEISIPLIHIANEIIRERIAFVKEAYSLGYTLPLDHLISHQNALMNFKIFFQLKQVDFDLFESIIMQCSKEVSCSLKDTETLIPIQYFLKCERLFEENIYLFHHDVKLDTLRHVITVMLLSYGLVWVTWKLGSLLNVQFISNITIPPNI